mgnify:CR=1 FL=1
MPKLPSSRVALTLESSLLSTFLKLILCRPSLAYEGSGYPIFCTELSVGIIGIYGIGSHASYPHIHKFLLHADAVLQAYPSLKAFEREVFNERYAVYLYVVDLRTELDRLLFLYLLQWDVHNDGQC